jgi:hypothetical protein
MKTPLLSSSREKTSTARHASQLCVATVLVGFICFGWANLGHTQPAADDVPGAEVLTRGPVHEAFAGMVTFNPEPGIVISKAPPEVIEEMPPEERPEGDNVSWIPGYWGWDDERSDFLWVSGTWRALPPGRAWMAGYWGANSARSSMDFWLLGGRFSAGNHLSATAAGRPWKSDPISPRLP